LPQQTFLAGLDVCISYVPSGIDRSAILSNIDFAALTVHTVYTYDF
jgi:hypothetical protein